jgi:pimeloyl-ACP methyl ester carboxylesterase
MTGKNNLRSIFCVLSLSTLIACGGGDESPASALETQLPPQPTTQSYSVTVIDGYLSSAKVWLDLNDNGSQDINEPTTVTEKNGKATLTIDSGTDPKNYSVMVLAQSGITFDESLNQLIEKDFILASPKGENIVTPLTTLVYLKNREVGDIESAKSLISEQFNLTPQRIFEDFIASSDTEQEAIAADIVRLSLMAKSEGEFTNLLSDSNVLFENISEYLTLKVSDGNQIRVIRDLSGELARDTDLDDIADTDDQDIDGDSALNEVDAFPYDSNEWEDLDNDGIGNNSDTDTDGDGILNDEDDNPLLAEFNTIKNPGELKVSELLTGNITQDQWQYFTVESPEDVMLNFSISNLTDDVDLYVKQGESPTKFDYLCRSNLSNSEAEKCVVRAKEVSIYHIGILARQNANFELIVESEAIVYQKVMLLLHGLASEPGTWDAMVNDDSFFNGSCQTLTIDNDTLLDVETNNEGISCFNLEFGSLDRDSDFSAAGLDNKTCNSALGCNGDYTTFEGLGYEVDAAIGRIVEKLGQDIEVFMFGHSRGGLAARYYLQNSEQTNRSRVKGFATTGTPHQGSPLGRFYQYMHDNCIPKSTYRQDNSKCEDNWEVIEMLQGTRTYFGFDIGLEYQMDLQAPSIDFLSPYSLSILSINEDLHSLNGLIMGQLTYEGTSFGVLSKDAGISDQYDLYAYGTLFAGDHPHPDTLRYIEDGQTRASLKGDGIVPSDSQRLSLLLDNEGIEITVQGSQKSVDILHIEETSKVSDINWLFERLYPSLGWK